MKSKILGLLAVGLLAGPMAADAGLITVNATSVNAASTTDWSLIFDDTSGDGLLQIVELLSFSGTTVFGTVYTGLLGTPNVAGVSTQSGFTGGIAGDYWWLTPSGFGEPADGWLASRWTYTTRATSVPEPASLALLGLGLAGLGLSRRRKVA